jgi:hypothetical protein
MLAIFCAYLASRLMWRLLRAVVLIAALFAVVLLASRRDVSIGRLSSPGFWRSQATAVQREVQGAVQRGLRPSPSSGPRRR